MLYVVGLGLSDETDITVKGLEAVRKSERVYLEAYTSILTVGKEKLVCLKKAATRSGRKEEQLKLKDAARKSFMESRWSLPTVKWSNQKAMSF